MEAFEAIPPHVPADRVYDFDLYKLDDDPRLGEDVQGDLSFLYREAPDLFYTPANGGHWVATRYELMRQVLQDTERFSARQTTVPKGQAQQRLVPLTLDPPEHTPFRQLLMRYFAPKTIQAMESAIRARARGLVAAVVANGGCDFMNAVAAPLPVYVFLELMGLPDDKFAVFRSIVTEWFTLPNGPRRTELAQMILGHLREAIEARQSQPRDDLITKLMGERIDGQPMSQLDLESMCFLLFLAGLDTVANGAGFMFRRLAMTPELQARLCAEPEAIPGFVDEALRTSGVSFSVRTAIQDVELGGAKVKAGDIVMCPLVLGGYDDQSNPDPGRFDIDRRGAAHLMFSTGPHLCVGHVLAKLELRIIVEEWLAAIPRFSLAPGYVRDVRIGSIIGLMSLKLAWPA